MRTTNTPPIPEFATRGNRFPRSKMAESRGLSRGLTIGMAIVVMLTLAQLGVAEYSYRKSAESRERALAVASNELALETVMRNMADAQTRQLEFLLTGRNTISIIDPISMSITDSWDIPGCRPHEWAFGPNREAMIGCSIPGCAAMRPAFSIPSAPAAWARTAIPMRSST